jgi:hypothetical protein
MNFKKDQTVTVLAMAKGGSLTHVGTAATRKRDNPATSVERMTTCIEDLKKMAI